MAKLDSHGQFCFFILVKEYLCVLSESSLQNIIIVKRIVADIQIIALSELLSHHNN